MSILIFIRNGSKAPTLHEATMESNQFYIRMFIAQIFACDVNADCNLDV
jgi:hypothetical protein